MGDPSKLPKWAQLEIERLTSNVEYWKKKVEVGPDDSDTFVRQSYDSAQPLGDSPRIEFRFGEGWGEVIEAHLIYQQGKPMLRIDTHTGVLNITPSASNSIYVTIGDR